ncbi:MAG: DUF1573 domain-containing protein [Prevotella sp.]|nr:DUF1573 domain-containing protein [Prevotella sp.]
MNKKTIITSLLMLAILPVSAQKLIATKTTIDVGKTGFQQPVTAVFEFKNKSIRRLTIESVQPDCSCTTVDYPKKVIGMGEKFEIKMTYDAKMLGHFDKQAAIISNGTKKPVYIRMKGIVSESYQDFSGDYPIEMGNMRIDKNELEFDNVNKGEKPIAQIHVYNNGTGLMRPNLMHLPSYLSATVAPEEIRPGRSATISVTLNSNKVSDYGLTQESIYLAANPGDKATKDNLIGVSTVLLPSFTKMTATQKLYAPKMYLSKEQVDIVFDGKSKKKDEIQISNTGRTPLTISSLQMFTEGLQISLGKSTLQTGESTKLKITAQRDVLKNVRTKPRILMITNDPDQSKVVITINVK